MFIASGLDLSYELCALVILDKTGEVLEHLKVQRDPHIIAQAMEAFAHTENKTIFCALDQLDDTIILNS